MKRLIISILCTFLVATLSAQDYFGEIYEQYKSKRGFTTLIFGDDMLKLVSIFGSGSADEPSEGPQVTTCRMILAESPADAEELYNSAHQIFEKSKYVRIMEINHNQAHIETYANPKADKYCEFVMLVEDKSSKAKKLVLIDLKGDFSADDVCEMSTHGEENPLIQIRAFENDK